MQKERKCRRRRLADIGGVELQATCLHASWPPQVVFFHSFSRYAHLDNNSVFKFTRFLPSPLFSLRSCYLIPPN